jgi:hypothetical protein
VNLVEQTKGLVEAAICQTVKDNPSVELPGIGEELDFKPALQKALGEIAKTISVAGMKRLDDVDDRAVYSTQITIVDAEGNSRKIGLTHSPAADGTNSTFNGKMTLERDGDVGGIQLPGENQQQGTKKRLLSVQYARLKVEDEYRVRYELRTAQMIEFVAKNAFVDGVLDLNASTNADGKYIDANKKPYDHNGGAQSIKYITFDVNPDTNVGSFSYWKNPGQNYTENTRGMVFDLKIDDAGKFRGCANSGSAGDAGNGLSIRKALKEGNDIKPIGSYHPFFSTENLQNCTLDTPVDGSSDSGGIYYQKKCTSPGGGGEQISKWYRPKVLNTNLAAEFAKKQHSNIFTRQCYVQQEDGKYAVDTDEIKDDAGYELIKATDTTKVVGPPPQDGVRR